MAYGPEVHRASAQQPGAATALSSKTSLHPTLPSPPSACLGSFLVISGRYWVPENLNSSFQILILKGDSLFFFQGQ
jgi:hypothetical protein